MDKKMYLVKAIKANNQVVDYEVKMQVDKPFKPRGGGYEILYGVKTDFPKASLDVKGEWQVIEDATKKDAQSQKENQQNARKAQLIAAINSLDVNTKLTDIVPLMKKLLQHILNQ